MGRVNDGDECDGQDRDVTGGPDEARRILAATLARIQVAMIMRGDRPAGEVLAEIGTALDGLGDALEDGTAGVPDGSGPPEVRRSPCEADQGEDHVQVRTGGNWLCVRALRGLDAGWVELAAQLEEARAERDRHAAASRILDRAIGRQERHLHAARIDVARGSLDAAAEVLNEALDGYEGEPAWDGKETGAQWLERARPKATGPATMDDLAAMPGVTTILIATMPQGRAFAEVRLAGERVAVIGRTPTGLEQFDTVKEWEDANGAAAGPLPSAEPPPVDRAALEGLAASWAEPARPGTSLTHDEIVEQGIYQECARSLRDATGEQPAPSPAEPGTVPLDAAVLHAEVGRLAALLDAVSAVISDATLAYHERYARASRLLAEVDGGADASMLGAEASVARDAQVARLRDELADERARFADADQRNDRVCSKLAAIRQLCEQPEHADRALPTRVLRIIGGAQ